MILRKISRGSNLEGYAGIKKISTIKNYQIIRPLLEVTKEDIINYNKSHNITYFVDSSNTNINYTRNRYRKNIVPLLKKEDKNIHKKFLKYSETRLEYDNYIKSLVKNNIDKIYENNIININELLKLDNFLIKNTLYYILNNIYSNKNNIITERHINNILSIINNSKPNLRINLPNNKVAIKEYDKLIIKDNNNKKEHYKIEFNDYLIINNLEFSIINNTEDDSNYICRLCSNNIEFPLYFRNRKDGDYIILKGSNNKKKIKEILIEKKVPISKSKNKKKKNEKYDIIIKCKEREENYE